MVADLIRHLRSPTPAEAADTEAAVETSLRACGPQGDEEMLGLAEKLLIALAAHLAQETSMRAHPRTLEQFSRAIESSRISIERTEAFCSRLSDVVVGGRAHSILAIIIEHEFASLTKWLRDAEMLASAASSGLDALANLASTVSKVAADADTRWSSPRPSAQLRAVRPI